MKSGRSAADCAAHGLPPESEGWFGGSNPARPVNRDRAFPMLRDVLHAVVQRGTGRAAALSVPTFGKTGTTSDYRDAWFIGFAPFGNDRTIAPDKASQMARRARRLPRPET